MEDRYIWGLVAFLRELPKLDAVSYQAMVASSAGHSHGGGEIMPHGDGEAAGNHHGAMPREGIPEDMSAPDMVEHRHADGTVESHPAPQPTKADDGHEHQH